MYSGWTKPVSNETKLKNLLGVLYQHPMAKEVAEGMETDKAIRWLTQVARQVNGIFFSRVQQTGYQVRTVMGAEHVIEVIDTEPVVKGGIAKLAHLYRIADDEFDEDMDITWRVAP